MGNENAQQYAALMHSTRHALWSLAIGARAMLVTERVMEFSWGANRSAAPLDNASLSALTAIQENHVAVVMARFEQWNIAWRDRTTGECGLVPDAALWRPPADAIRYDLRQMRLIEARLRRDPRQPLLIDMEPSLARLLALQPPIAACPAPSGVPNRDIARRSLGEGESRFGSPDSGPASRIYESFNRTTGEQPDNRPMAGTNNRLQSRIGTEPVGQPSRLSPAISEHDIDYWLDKVLKLCGREERRNRGWWANAIRDHFDAFNRAYEYTVAMRDAGTLKTTAARCLNASFLRNRDSRAPQQFSARSASAQHNTNHQP